jgi:hypothetical protein
MVADSCGASTKGETSTDVSEQEAEGGAEGGKKQEHGETNARHCSCTLLVHMITASSHQRSSRYSLLFFSLPLSALRQASV